MICKKCGFEENVENAFYCTNCGEPLVKKCKRCNHELKDEELYCSVCGTKYGSAPSVMYNSQVPTINSASRVLGIISLSLAFVSFFIFGFLAFFGLIMSIIGLVNSNKDEFPDKTAKVINIIAIPICSIFSVMYVIVLMNM